MLGTPLLGSNPSFVCRGEAIEPRNVRLNIDERGIVQDIDPINFEDVAAPSQESYD